MKDHVSNVTKLDSIFDPASTNSLPIAWGKSHEKIAIQQYEKEHNVLIQPSGLFISIECGGLGASPDGLIGDDGLIEVKCPFKERRGLPQDVADRKPRDFLTKTNGVITLNKTHKYYDQVVMQLHVTKRAWCDFAVWTQGTACTGHLLVLRITKHETLNRWNEMKPKLIRFFKQDLVPEIVDSMFDKNMGYRQPEYRAEAIESYLKKQEEKKDRLSQAQTRKRILPKKKIGTNKKRKTNTTDPSQEDNLALTGPTTSRTASNVTSVVVSNSPLTVESPPSSSTSTPVCVRSSGRVRKSVTKMSI
jgi:uncharacterized protein YdaU (DUF1376 family)